LDVGGPEGDPVYDRHYAASQAEDRGEDLRHLYVALTRAKHQAVIWWAGANGCQFSALGRLLLARSPSGDVKTEIRASEAKDARVEAELNRRAAQVPGLISIEHCSDSHPLRSNLAGSNEAGLDLRTASFDRDLDLGWRRSSYTSITAEAHGAVSSTVLVGSEPEASGTTDEPAAPAVPAVPVPASGEGAESDAGADAEVTPARTGAPSLLSAMPAGATFGTLVHRVLENVDFAAPDLHSDLLQCIDAEATGYAEGTTGDPAQLAIGLEAAMSMPLGGLAGATRLRDLGRTDRLDELAFELPVAGGDDPVGEILLTDLARMFSRHVPPGRPLAGYATDLSSPHMSAHLRGYLTGSLDLVFRLRTGPGRQRFFVVDYKTNWLGGTGEVLTAWHYRSDALEAEMRRAHYPLQAMLYLVALHRYLRWRVPGYDPSEDLGGAFYLFLRGMACPGAAAVAGSPCGVFAWSPPAELVTGLSDLLAGQTEQGLGAK
jgi:exodeoxyribonuclease V beta subunit